MRDGDRMFFQNLPIKVLITSDNSQPPRANFMKTIQNFQKEDKDNGKGADVNVQFDKNTSSYIPKAPTNVALRKSNTT